MDMETFVKECRECDPQDTERVSELLAFGAELGEAILEARGKRERIPYAEVMELYNNICVSLPKAHKLSTERKSHIRSCFTQKFTLKDFETAFRTVQRTPFLRGENGRGWHATFDWIIKPSNLLKVLENTYGRSASRSGTDPSFDLEAIMDRAKYGKPKI